ncbi:MAG: LysR family transcriptional regulator [Nocardioides sp.]|nr:LysR family transcriptional regulator [Nocardioides sp.]
MEIRQLRCVVAVAEELHFGRAAQRLQMSQAPLSAQIKRIEREIGYPLFERTTRSVRLTTVGAELYRRATAILEQVDQATADLERVAAGRAGRLRVGFASSASYSILPHAVRRMRETAPELDLELVPLTSAEQVDRLHEGSLDIGLVRGEAGALDLPTERLLEEEIVACVPGDHALAEKDVVTAEDLSTEEMIFFPARDIPGFVAEIRPIFNGLAFPHVRARVVHQETALGFVAAGMGFTLLPESVSAFMPAAVRVARIASRPTTVMCIARASRLAPAAEVFRHALFEAASTPGAT